MNWATSAEGSVAAGLCGSPTELEGGAANGGDGDDEEVTARTGSASPIMVCDGSAMLAGEAWWAI